MATKTTAKKPAAARKTAAPAAKKPAASTRSAAPEPQPAPQYQSSGNGQLTLATVLAGLVLSFAIFAPQSVKTDILKSMGGNHQVTK